MTEQERQERMEKLFEKMLNMEMTNREMYEQYRNMAHEPMTNEEYIKSLNTEQLAELLYEYRYDNATPQQRLWLFENEGYCKKCITEWLKEIHTGGES